MLLKVIYIIFVILYSALLIISIVKGNNRKGIRKLDAGNTFLAVGSLLLFFSSAAAVVQAVSYLVPLVVGLVLIHIGALANGYKLYKKPHLNHHIIRLGVSLVIAVTFYLIVRPM
ncbi:hypothetical protein QA584_23350 [Anaerocolumna sp. AGMB13025]|uniref:hypothetical protein n=1 Tax=Anaerocolumna sp. AGMB13025 TaxID=3039116 RepID=UPI00241FF768|nr:hypothetical protein [Anaerocolumna sp. AGMB13025]WFR56520.1 hypothetical protein QA584_23350 [Anaerocolumna sp. AGMB13025]